MLDLPKNFFEQETGLGLIATERFKILKHPGRGAASDLWNYPNGELIKVAKNLLFRGKASRFYIWLNPYKWSNWGKMLQSSYKRRLIIAGQLICAELDRIIAIEE